MQWLYPRFPANRLPSMVRIALLGAAIAAVYGAAHDQLSFALSTEYFTRFKFHQFAWADMGWPPRQFASVVGVLATWWVGLVAGWLLARAGLAELPVRERWAKTFAAFAIVAVVALIGGLIGWVLGVAAGGDLTGWSEWKQSLGITNLPAFVVVAYLHAGGYLGALAGLVLAIVYVRCVLARSRREGCCT
jgi:hypothetical protein